MARFEVETGGRRFEVEAPSREAFLEAMGTPQQPELSAGEIAADVATRGMGGINRAVANTLMLPFRASAWLTGTQGRGFEGAGEQALSPWLNQPEPQSRAGRYASSVGEAVGSTAGPSAAVFGLARRLPAVAASTMPQQGWRAALREGLVRPVANAPGTAAAIDLTASTGAGLATEATREAGGGPVAQTLASLAGGVAVPVVGSMAARDIMRGVEAAASRYGIRASADGGMGATPEAQRRALQLLADQLLREGKSVADVENLLGEVQRSRAFHSSGRAQDVVTLADLVPGWRRLAGSAARQFPEVETDIGQFQAARQTGITPTGVEPRELARRGLPTRGRFDPEMTAEQAQRQLGSTFEAGEGNVVAMGARRRSIDAMKRLFHIKDSDFHGHARNPYRTEEQILAAMKQASDPAYKAAFGAGDMVGLQVAATVRPILERWAQQAAEAAPAIGSVLKRAVRQFYTTGNKNEIVANLRRFDSGKQALDKLIQDNLGNPIGRLLQQMKVELLAAVDTIEAGNVGQLYSKARGIYSGGMEERDILTRYRDFWKNGDPNQVVDDYAALKSPEQQKLARLGLVWGHESETVGRQSARDMMQSFNTPRVQEIIGGVAERTPGLMREGPQRFGRYLDFERSFIDTRDVTRGGSTTARNIQDDLAYNALETVQNVQTFMGLFRGSVSMWDFGQRIMERIIDRSFGMSADAGKALARMLFTANPIERAQVLHQLAATMPKDRMARFNELMQRASQAAAPSTAATAGTAMQQRTE